MNTQPVGNGGGAGATAPPATTGAATNITATSAVLTGTVLPSSCPSGRQPVFLYGSTTNYGNAALGAFVAPSNLPTPVMATVTGLEPGTEYHVRLTANDSCGTTAQINDVVFFTPAPTVEPAVPASAMPPSGPTIRDVATTRDDGHGATVVVRLDGRGCADQPLSVRVALRDETGAPVPGAAIDVAPTNGPAEAATASRGNDEPVVVSLVGLLPGMGYTVRASVSNACGATTGAEVSLPAGPATDEPSIAMIGVGVAATMAMLGAAVVMAVVRRRSRQHHGADPTGETPHQPA